MMLQGIAKESQFQRMNVVWSTAACMSEVESKTTSEG